MAKHDHAFDKGTDEDKLAATSEQYQEQTGQDAAPEAGPDPIIEATDKAAKEADYEPAKDQATVRKEIEEEQEKAWKQTPPSEPLEDAQARAKKAEEQAKKDAGS